MIIDIIFVVLLLLAIIRGFQRGLIVGLFSFIAILIGLAAAIKLSAVVAAYLGRSVKISEQWLPLVSFLLVFLVIVLLVRLAAKAIEKTVQIAMLGWVNRIGGVLFFVALYTIVFSILLFYAEQMQLIKPETIRQSVTYTYIQPWGPAAINAFGSVIPFFRDMFEELKQFFGNVAQKIPAA